MQNCENNNTNQDDFNAFINAAAFEQNIPKTTNNGPKKISHDLMNRIVFLLRTIFECCIQTIVDMYYSDEDEQTFYMENIYINSKISRIIWDAIISVINILIQNTSEEKDVLAIGNAFNKIVMNIYKFLPAILSAEYRYNIIKILLDDKNEKNKNKDTNNAVQQSNDIDIDIDNRTATSAVHTTANNNNNEIFETTRKGIINDISGFIYFYLYNSFDIKNSYIEPIATIISRALSDDKSNEYLLKRFANSDYNYDQIKSTIIDKRNDAEKGIYALFDGNMSTYGNYPILTETFSKYNIICKQLRNQNNGISYMFLLPKTHDSKGRNNNKRRKYDTCFVYNDMNKEEDFLIHYKIYRSLKSYNLVQYLTSVWLFDDNIIDFLLKNPKEIQTFDIFLQNNQDNCESKRYTIYEYPKKRILINNHETENYMNKYSHDLKCVIRLSNYTIIQYPKSIGCTHYLSLLSDRNLSDNDLRGKVLKAKINFDNKNKRIVETSEDKEGENITNDINITNVNIGINNCNSNNTNQNNPIGTNNNNINNNTISLVEDSAINTRNTLSNQGSLSINTSGNVTHSQQDIHINSQINKDSVPTTEIPTIEIPTIEIPNIKIPTIEIPTSEIPTTEIPTPEKRILSKNVSYHVRRIRSSASNSSSNAVSYNLRSKGNKSYKHYT